MSEQTKITFMRVTANGRGDGKVPGGLMSELGFEASGQTVVRHGDSVLVVNADPEYTLRMAARYNCSAEEVQPNLGQLYL